jgi:hypothetical protein
MALMAAAKSSLATAVEASCLAVATASASEFSSGSLSS